MVSKNHKRLAIPVAAIMASIGTLILIFNALSVSAALNVYTAVGILFYIFGGIVWFLLAKVSKNHKHLAIPVVAIMALIGTMILIFNAVINPLDIQIPEITPPVVSPPQINIPQR